MFLEYQLQAHGEDAMVALGRKFGQALGAVGEGATIFLKGDLGMGKTTFTRGVLARHPCGGTQPSAPLLKPPDSNQE